MIKKDTFWTLNTNRHQDMDKSKTSGHVTYPDDNLKDLSEALIGSFNTAIQSGRLCLGLSESLDLLDYEPSSIVVCVLPYVKELNDPLKHLHLLLMEAFCKEHAIRILKVASMEGFCHLLKLLQRLDPANPYDIGDVEPSDASDLLIIKEVAEKSAAEDVTLKSVYDVIAVRHAASGGVLPLVLPPVFPTYFDAV